MPNGIIIIDKPAGWTSMDVCAKIRGILREKRVGHAGTLDPMATGVLPVFVGSATKAVSFAEDGQKEYIAGLRLGITTDTQDTSGTVLTTAEVQQAVDAGARYIISPNVNPDVIRETKRLGAVSIPGALTPTEVATAYAYGADFVKLFPAGELGLSYIKAIRAPLAHIPMLAVGGVNENNLGGRGACNSLLGPCLCSGILNL